MGKIIRASKAYLLTITLLFAIPALVLYVSLAVYGRRLLTPNEWGRFAGIISFATIAHMDANGGPRAWAIAGESLSDTALSQVSLELNAQTHQIPQLLSLGFRVFGLCLLGFVVGFEGRSPSVYVQPAIASSHTT